MKTLKSFFLIVCFSLISCSILSQENEDQKIKPNQPTCEQMLESAVWRTDAYICTGISYAKSLGMSVDDFAKFVGNAHAEMMLWMKGQGLEPIVQMFSSIGATYKNAEFEILFQSDSLVTLKGNRPYEVYFENGPMLGVTIDEYERYLYSHLVILLNKISVDMIYKIEDEYITTTLSLRK